MSVLNLSCVTKEEKNKNTIIIRNDNVTILKNNQEEGKMPLKDLFWNANNIINYQISLPKNSIATIDPTCMSSSAANVKVIFIKAENEILVEQKYENDKLFFTYNDNPEIPLGKFTVLSGTDLNRIDGAFVIYNGTPNANVSNISDGQYDVTIDIIAGF